MLTLFGPLRSTKALKKCFRNTGGEQSQNKTNKNKHHHCQAEPKETFKEKTIIRILGESGQIWVKLQTNSVNLISNYY